jgi:hypothetical protein
LFLPMKASFRLENLFLRKIISIHTIGKIKMES